MEKFNFDLMMFIDEIRDHHKLLQFILKRTWIWVDMNLIKTRSTVRFRWIAWPELRIRTIFSWIVCVMSSPMWMFFSVSMERQPQEAAVVVLKVQGSVSGLAVDWIHELLYWTSIESGSVNIGLLDGSVQRQLITGLDKPSGVALDPLQG